MRLTPLEELLPIGPPMLWLDEALRYELDPPALTCGVTVRRDHPYAEGDTVPALCALEWMAQAAHALCALRARARGGEGAPRLLARVAEARFVEASFGVGDVLSIEARAHADGVFACSVRRAGQVLCAAQLTLSERARPERG